MSGALIQRLQNLITKKKLICWHNIFGYKAVSSKLLTFNCEVRKEFWKLSILGWTSWTCTNLDNLRIACHWVRSTNFGATVFDFLVEWNQRHDGKIILFYLLPRMKVKVNFLQNMERLHWKKQYFWFLF